MLLNSETSGKRHYRNHSFDFESFKNVFKNNSIMIMRKANASGFDRAIEAVSSAFACPDLSTIQIIELKNAIVCIATGNSTCTNDEMNEIGKYCLNQIKRGATLTLDRMEAPSLQNEIRVSVLISGFDSKD
jgi:cell division GTPase FtsZ